MQFTLKSLSLDNWKSIRTLSLDFSDINVLIGPNGSGKSNVVQFFHFLNMMMSGNLQLSIGRAGGASSLLHYGPKQSIFIDSKIEFGTDTATDSFSFRLIHGAPDTFVFASESVEYREREQAKPFKKEFGAGHKESYLLEQNLTGATAKSVGVVRALLSKVRYFQFHDTSNEAHIRTTAKQENNRSLYHNGGNVAAILLRLQSEFPDAYNNVVQRVRSGVPAFRDFILEPENGGILLQWADRHRGQTFGPHQLSDGSIRLIALHTLLSLPSQMAPSVAVIDEPELGLFPAAIESLAEAIKTGSQRFQIVLATQSNRLVRYLNPKSLICCAWKDGESQIERLDPAREFEFLDGYTLGDYFERKP